MIKEKYGYRFSFGPWNIHEGADPFGPPVCPTRDFESKLTVYKELGFDAVQFHDDDAVPELNDLSAAQIRQRAQIVHQKLVDLGLVAEFVAPRLWEYPMTIDGAFTSNDPIRVGVLMESAHAILVGLDPSDEISFAMSSGKLMSVHLNDQNGLKYDQDRSFGSVDLRRAFNQVRILATYNTGRLV